MDVNNILTTQSRHNYNLMKHIRAGVVKLVDALDSKSSKGNLVGVQVPPPAPLRKPILTRLFAFCEGPFFVSYIFIIFAVFNHFLPEIAVRMAEILA
jgi:hypothetical protein